MKNISVLTFQNSDNFGALLQAFALQKTLEKMNNRVTIIDYHSPNKDYSILSIKKGKKLRNYLIDIYTMPNKLLKRSNGNKFRKQYLNISEKKFENFNELTELNDHFDFFIAGSDQIWNFENTKFDTTYLLDFVKNNLKKISYAASFGVKEIPRNFNLANNRLIDLESSYKSYLEQFKSISVREYDGKNIISKMINKDVAVVLDPTMLLTAKEWEGYLPEKDEYEEYILVYSLFSDELMYEKIYKFSQESKLPVKIIFPAGKKIKKYNFESVKPDILEFVALFKDSKYVITDSFHGTVFSIMFNKNFWAYNGGASNFSRIDNLLHNLKLENQIITNVSEIDFNKSIDFNYANQKIIEERNHSIEFLNTSLLF